jgi:hypothetical protein
MPQLQHYTLLPNLFVYSACDIDKKAKILAFVVLSTRLQSLGSYPQMCFPLYSLPTRKRAHPRQHFLGKFFKRAHFQNVMNSIATMTSKAAPATDDNLNLHFEVHHATDDDFDLFMEPLFGVMGRAVFVSALWPNNQTELGRKRAKERWLKEM